jgi:homopolymeric O-antigen transport system permease protein
MRSLVVDCREMLSEQIEYRELLYQMTMRDLLIRYKQAIMGFGWAIFMPLVNTAVFTVIFTRVTELETPVPYPVFAYSGLLAWNFFASSLRFSVTSLTGNAVLVTKVYFPREIFPFSAVAVCAVDFAVGSLVLVALMLYYQVGVTTAILWLPVIIAIQVLFTAGIALMISMANLFYRDIKYLFEVVITVWMFATSVVYPLDRIGGVLGQVIAWNPMSPIIDAYRNVVLFGVSPPAALWWAGAVSGLTLIVGWVFFHRAEFQFAENI